MLLFGKSGGGKCECHNCHNVLLSDEKKHCVILHLSLKTAFGVEVLKDRYRPGPPPLCSISPLDTVLPAFLGNYPLPLYPLICPSLLICPLSPLGMLQTGWRLVFFLVTSGKLSGSELVHCQGPQCWPTCRCGKFSRPSDAGWRGRRQFFRGMWVVDLPGLGMAGVDLPGILTQPWGGADLEPECTHLKRDATPRGIDHPFPAVPREGRRSGAQGPRGQPHIP